MSERGSFVTQYIYCRDCFNALWKVLDSREKYLCTTRVPTWEKEGTFIPIIAGKAGGLYSGEEVHLFDLILRGKIEDAICHNVTIAVIPDDAKYQKFIEFVPKNPKP